jgi:lysophospholipase L1-like esterase
VERRERGFRGHDRAPRLPAVKEGVAARRWTPTPAASFSRRCPAWAHDDPERIGERRDMITVYTFGDSILDSAGYNEAGLDPGQLLVRNDDARFPEFRGKDLASRGSARLEHRARDGATAADLPTQVRGLRVQEPAVALVTVGGNDLLRGLVLDPGPGIDAFAAGLERFVRDLPVRPILVGNVYDPTFGDDARNFLGVDPVLARLSYARVNLAIARVAGRHASLVDLHAHFLTGDPSWFTKIVEPSLLGASEVRRCFLRYLIPEDGPGKE